MAELGFLYQYSLQFFLDAFADVLYHNPHLEGVKDPTARLDILVRSPRAHPAIAA